MKNLFFTIVIVALAAALTFFVLSPLLSEGDFADSIYEKGIPLAFAGFVLALFPYVYQWVSRMKGRLSFSLLPGQIVPFDHYTLPGSLLLVQGTILVFAASGLGIFIIWLIGLGTGFFLTQAVPILETIFATLAVNYTAAWIGARADRRPYLTSVGVVLAFILFFTLARLATGSGFAVISSILRLALYLMIALIGTRQGLRARSTRYVHYLLEFLPIQERRTVLDEVYDQVSQLHPDKALEEPEEVEGELEAGTAPATLMESPPADHRS